jgi:Ca-activated chloride channel homolog
MAAQNCEMTGKLGSKSTKFAILLLALVCLGGAVWLRAQQGVVAGVGQDVTSVRITSPLGRTGLVTKVRIVAQVHVQTGSSISAVSFFVDGMLVGMVENGPPYSVEWVDDNPFERRELVVQAADASGQVFKDTIVLPPYEVNDRTEVTSILLETSVYDKAGKFVTNLKPEVFGVTENGSPQKIDLVARETIPTNLLILVDNSQSMGRRMDFVRAAAERLARSLRENDRAIVAPFNAHVGTITGPTDDAATIAQAIAAMQAKGGTAMFDAMIEGMRLLNGLEGRRAVVLITDGYDENSAAGVDDVMRAAEEAGATVYTVAIGGVAGVSLKGQGILKKITEVTGGRSYIPPREAELAPLAEAIATDTHSRYLITYTPVNQKKDGTWRGIAIDVPEGLKVRTRSGYFAPAAPPIRPTIEFTIMDSARNYLDVTSEDLDVIEDGIKQSVDTFQEAVDPVSIVMALDSSGSMKKAADLVRATAKEFVVAVRPEDSLALVTFADEPKFAHTLAKNREWSLEAIEKYKADGGTALYDAMWNSLKHLQGVQGRRAIVLLSDGKDEDNPGKAPGSQHTFEEVLELTRTVGAMVFTVGLGTKVDKPVMEQFSKVSGGQSFYATNEMQLSTQFHQVVEGLRRRYVLSYVSTNSNHNGAWRKVEIKPRANGRVVSTRGGYFAPEN